MNQGMLMESMNLAAAWSLPVLFVCKDDGWSIATGSSQVTGGNLVERARGLGLAPVEADGLDVESVWTAAGEAVESIRAGGAPVFLHSRCTHLEGHFLGFQLLRGIRDPLREIPAIAGPLIGSILNLRGAPLAERTAGLRAVLSTMRNALRDPARAKAGDPVSRARASLDADPQRRDSLEEGVEREIAAVVSAALEEEEA